MSQGDIRRKIIKTLSNCAVQGTDNLEHSEEEDEGNESDRRVMKRKAGSKKNNTGKVARRESESSDGQSDGEN